MICYKDMTFCTHYHYCWYANKCPRPLTPKVKQEAKEWWGKSNSEPPIAIYSAKPYCWSSHEKGT